MFTNLDFVRGALPGGKAPSERTCGYDLLNVPVTIPFAVMAHDNGLDYGEDENGNEYSYQDSPPCDFVYAAFLTKTEAEAFVNNDANKDRKNPLWIVEDVIEPLWAFNHLYWEGKKHFNEFALTEEEANQLNDKLIKVKYVDEFGYEYERVCLAQD